MARQGRATVVGMAVRSKPGLAEVGRVVNEEEDEVLMDDGRWEMRHLLIRNFAFTAASRGGGGGGGGVESGEG
ncbi:hypothetical protein BDDG_07178 [Blastomyces dermatitidis ATCC 18188]|uniref:Uncharacterized protein n=1 Tax=Ajellomyces dermatitidis (strain ATCC 18188 / CBS 674.68) TaxID=653446 RepID=F2TLX0_AJEDA|nr:hypothetical protein BDDG_07178 [Blastomyces dermatitidis ATCC 18188]